MTLARFRTCAMGAISFALVTPAVAEGFFSAEVGLGMQNSRDMGDGIWYQSALPHREQTRSPAFLIGATGKLWANGGTALRYHADYVYFGAVSASCLCVPDENYDPSAHKTIGKLPRLSPFNGSGHTQGVAFTLELSHEWHGWRAGIEAGPWLYWQTWHESLYALDNQWHDLSHRTAPQIGYVAGARVERGALGLSYRYYSASQKWNPNPGLVTGTHMLMATYRF